MNSRLMKVTLLVAILAVTFLVIFPLGLGRTLIWGYNGQGSMMGQGQNQSGMMGQRSSFFSPIFLIGGLVRLALLGGLAGLAFIFLRGVWSGFYQPTR